MGGFPVCFFVKLKKKNHSVGLNSYSNMQILTHTSLMFVCNSCNCSSCSSRIKHRTGRTVWNWSETFLNFLVWSLKGWVSGLWLQIQIIYEFISWRDAKIPKMQHMSQQGSIFHGHHLLVPQLIMFHILCFPSFTAETDHRSGQWVREWFPQQLQCFMKSLLVHISFEACHTILWPECNCKSEDMTGTCF